MAFQYLNGSLYFFGQYNIEDCHGVTFNDNEWNLFTVDWSSNSDCKIYLIYVAFRDKEVFVQAYQPYKKLEHAFLFGTSFDDFFDKYKVVKLVDGCFEIQS